MSESNNRHHDRTDLAGEHRYGDAGQMICALVFLVVWSLDSFILEWSTFLNGYVPNWLQIVLGAVMLILGAITARSTMKTVFGEVRDPPVVIRTGMYRFSRHPMYFSELLVYLGMTFFSISLAGVAVIIGAAVFLTRLCRYEESLLVDTFGDAYREYMRDVPMFIPGLTLKKR